MPFGQVASAGVDRQFAAEFDAAVLDPVRGLADRRKAEALQRPEHMRREPIITVEGVDVAWSDAAGLEDRLGGAEWCVVVFLALIDTEAALAEDEFIRTGGDALIARADRPGAS